VLVHVGIAMTRIDEEDALETLDLYQQIIKENMEHEISECGDSALNAES
jgi:hydrogenase maturation factor